MGYLPGSRPTETQTSGLFVRSSMRTLPLLLLAGLFAIASGYQWEPVLSDSFPWRPSSSEATKKNCPKGEPCMADLSYAGYVPNNALKCQRSRDRLLEQYQNAKIGLV